MAREDFLKQWQVIDPALGETAGHLVYVEGKTGSGDGEVTITCTTDPAAHPMLYGTYSQEDDRIEGDDLDGNPFSIVLESPGIRYKARDNSNTGSWTAEDTSGQVGGGASGPGGRRPSSPHRTSP